MNIGNIITQNRIAVAPMAGVTDLAYRRILKSMGAGLLYTEMVSAKALCYKDKKTSQLMQITDYEQPIGVQIFGSEPEIMAEGAKIVESSVGAAFIDINMGCPVPKIAGNGEGSALMKNPGLAGEIIKNVVKAVKLPVTVKIRSGWDEDSINAIIIAKIAQDSGASMIAVHGRTRKQFYSGKADWNIIRMVKENVSIPVIGNGDILNYVDAGKMINETGCDGVMLARGVMGNPWLVAQCAEYLDNGIVTTMPTFEDRIAMALYHTKELARTKGELRGIKEARAHLTWYVKGQRGASKVKDLLTHTLSVAEVEDILNRWHEEINLAEEK